MSKNKLPTLQIGDLEINPPIVQGGMGARVSRGNLAAAVANEGSLGVIAAVMLGNFLNYPGSKFVEINGAALREEIRKARSMTNGPIGVNVMVALTDYENLAEICVEENVDIIISGAGLPIFLPKFLKGKDIKLVPIVSSVRALKIICRNWGKKFNKIPDAVIVEGEKAGGHLGFEYQDVINNNTPGLEQIVSEVIEFSKTFNPSIPVIAAGGIFNGKDIAHFLKLGASGVQMATRFVVTDECDVHENFKNAYLDCSKEEITIIKSPVGLPGRVINNKFVERIKKGELIPFKCNYHCLRTCDPVSAPYCIAKVLANASEGKLDEGFAFAGSNAYKCTNIVPVKVLIEQLVDETIENLDCCN